jgi:sulfhydrogenase subunit beta (sulfur reductase)
MSRPALLQRAAAQSLLDVLHAAGYRCFGPRVSDGAIVYEQLTDMADLPVGWGARQRPGAYRLEGREDQRCFAWANGPQALKPLLFSPRQTLFRWARDAEGRIAFEQEEPQGERWALIGARACDLAALALQDRHFLHKVRDPGYAARRANLLLLAVDCSHPAETCFCASTGDGPSVTGETDLALTELDAGFLVRAYTEAGAAVRDALPLTEPTAEQLAQAENQAEAAIAAQTRRMPGRNLPHLRKLR